MALITVPYTDPKTPGSLNHAVVREDKVNEFMTRLKQQGFRPLGPLTPVERCWPPKRRLQNRRRREYLSVAISHDEAGVVLFGYPRWREMAGRYSSHSRGSIAGELIDDLARLVFHDDGRLRLLRPLILIEGVNNSAGVLNGSRIVRQTRSLRIIDLFLIRLIPEGDDKGVTRHPQSM
jgi:hypothetical protein